MQDETRVGNYDTVNFSVGNDNRADGLNYKQNWDFWMLQSLIISSRLLFSHRLSPIPPWLNELRRKGNDSDSIGTVQPNSPCKPRGFKVVLQGYLVYTYTKVVCMLKLSTIPDEEAVTCLCSPSQLQVSCIISSQAWSQSQLQPNSKKSVTIRLEL